MRTLTDNSRKPATYVTPTGDQPTGRPLRSFLQPDPQVRPSKGGPARQPKLPADRSPSR
jgi:hypothetical protein